MDNLSIIMVLSCLGIAQALFLCMYLFTLNKGNRRAHIFLGLIILGLTIRIGKSILNTYFDLEPWQRNLGIAGILLVGPGLWLYGNALFKQKYPVRQKDLLHFIPFVLFSVFCFLIPNRFDALSLGIYYAVFGHLLLYGVLAAAIIVKPDKLADKAVLAWYRNLVIGVGIVWVFYIGNVLGVIPFYIGGAICYTFLIYIFSYLLLRKHTLHKEKYQGQRLDQNLSEELMGDLKKLFQEDSVYLNPQITLSEIAQRLGTNSKILSRVVNETTGRNFSEFVNSYRIERAKSLLASPKSKQDKIASIAYDSGFNNVTTFNLAFKAMTKLTPSEFREKML